ncbi:MAG: substrate-binding domain-containing protein [Prolixibacteraceae bacterium]|jgi:phosphate transport system substrate-binding protein|nr:substrate-binding domain-containing protein [Prolixibacteraceae bacterium]
MKILGVLLIFLALFSGCRFFKGDPYRNTPISGKCFIAVDETFRPVMEAEIELFKGIYGYSEIVARYLPESRVFDLLLKDSVQMIIATRMLRTDEVSVLNNRQLFPKQLKIATDAIALIVHPSCKDSLLTIKRIKAILGGEITSWNQLDHECPSHPIKLLFDNKNSGIVKYLADSICQGAFSAANASAMEYNCEVIEYTASHPDVLGFVSTSWIGNRNDSLHLSFHKKIKVVSVSNSSVPTLQNSYKPYQADLLDNMYPLSRSVYIINAEPRSGLATGLASFIASDKGQRIILKSGIVPAVAPTRVINVRPDL